MVCVNNIMRIMYGFTLSWCLVFVGINAESTTDLPLMSECAYQNELFEKIMQETIILQKEIKGMSVRMFGDSVNCPPFWFPGNGSCYHVQLGHVADWYEAQQSCESIGSHLVMLDTDEEIHELTEILQEAGGLESLLPVWIGARKLEHSRDWEGSDGSEIKAPSFKNHRVRHRDILCLHWDLEQRLTPHGCKRKLKFICEKHID